MYCDLLYHLREKGDGKRQMALQKGTLALYKIFLILQCPNLIKIETFVCFHFYTLSYFILKTVVLESEDYGLWIRKIVV